MIKIAFSTLGCPDWNFADVLSTAKDLGYDGIEIRGMGREMFAPKAKPFREENREATMKKLSNLKLEISCLTSGVRLNETFQIESHMDDARQYIDLAQAMNVPYVRVIGDSGPEATPIPFDAVADSLSELADYASNTNVTVLIENNGALAKSETMLELLERVKASNVQVLWDINHPVRNYGETADYTFEKLGDRVRYLHIKDSVMEDGRLEYKMPGHGDLPIKQTVTLLKSAGWSGWLSLEWVKRWCLSLAEPGIVFPQYINYMRNLLKE